MKKIILPTILASFFILPIATSVEMSVSKNVNQIENATLDIKLDKVNVVIDQLKATIDTLTATIASQNNLINSIISCMNQDALYKSGACNKIAAETAQTGAVSLGAGGSVRINFPTAFSSTPKVSVSFAGAGRGTGCRGESFDFKAYASSVSTTGFTLRNSSTSSCGPVYTSILSWTATAQ